MSERDHWDVKNDFDNDKVWDSGEREIEIENSHLLPSSDIAAEYRKLTRKERITLAEDIYEGRVFTDRHIDNPNMLMNVFMVLFFMSEEQAKSYRANPPGLIYEYIDQSAPRSINGMPCFFSCRMLSQEEASKVLGIYNMILSRKGNPVERKKV